MVVLLLARPYKNRVVNMFAFGAQLALVCVFGAATIIIEYIASSKTHSKPSSSCKRQA